MIQNSVIKNVSQSSIVHNGLYCLCICACRGEGLFQGKKNKKEGRSGNSQYLLHLSDSNTFKRFPMKDVSMWPKAVNSSFFAGDLQLSFHKRLRLWSPCLCVCYRPGTRSCSAAQGGAVLVGLVSFRRAMLCTLSACVSTTIHYCLITIHNVLKIISLGGLESKEIERLSHFLQRELIHFVVLYSPKGAADVQVLG